MIVDEYYNTYEYKLIKYYEFNFKAKKMQVINNRAVTKATTVIFYQNNQIIKSPIIGEETTLGLYRFLEEGHVYTTKKVKEIIKNEYSNKR